MKEATMATPKAETATPRHGVLPGVVHLAIDVADKSQSTAFAVLQDARIEIRTAVDQGIELVEKATAAAFRFTRKVVQRLDEASNETLTGAERVLGSAVKSARETTNAASQLATTAVSGVTASA
jgi:predicted nuclease with RNAse H fold